MPPNTATIPSSKAGRLAVADRLNVFLIAHFHYDPVWVETQATYTNQAFSLVQQYLDACARDPGYKLVLSELDYLLPFITAFPEYRQTIKQLVVAGRLQTGGSYNQPNENSVQGEALIRNILHGRSFHHHLLGDNPDVYLPLDVFGHIPQLSQILAKAGFQACLWSKEIAGAPVLWWQLSADGTRLLHRRERYWTGAMGADEGLGELILLALERSEDVLNLGLSADLRLLGGDMFAPIPWLTGRSQDLPAQLPPMQLAVPREYFSVTTKQVEALPTRLPLCSRDLALYHVGTAVSRADLKIANRLAENTLVNAEKFATVAALLGLGRYPDRALDKAWRQVLFGQHHDAITGTCCDLSFLDLLAGYREALGLASGVLERATALISGRVNTREHAPRFARALVVFNPLSWRRSEVCRVRVELDDELRKGFTVRSAGGGEAPCQLLSWDEHGDGHVAEVAFLAADLPSLGYRVFHLTPSRRLPAQPEQRTGQAFTIENEFFTVTADSQFGGGLTSIIDRRTGKQLLDQSRGETGNQLVALREQPDRIEPPWELFTSGERICAKDGFAEVTVERGPLMSRLEITGKLGDLCGYVQQVTLCRGVPRIDFETRLVNYRGQQEAVVVTFPLDLKGALPVFEDRFGVIARRKSKGLLDFRTQAGQAHSDCALFAAQNWLEHGQNVRVVFRPGASPFGAAGKRAAPSRSKSVPVGFPIGYCGLIAGAETPTQQQAERLTEALARKGVTVTPWPDDASPQKEPYYLTFGVSIGLKGKNQYSEWLLGHCSQEAMAYREQSLGRNGCSALVALESDLADGWPPAPVLIVEANDQEGLETAVSALVEDLEDGTIVLPTEANATGQQPALEDYGVALINQGTSGCSVEADDTLVLFLMHLSAWGGHDWGQGKLDSFLVPEHKTHVFRYALYPHAGDWRTAQTWRAGYEFNHPPLVRQEPIHEGALPAELSFLSLKGDNLAVAALKPRGLPTASHCPKTPADPSQGLIVRLYEAEGRAGTGELAVAAALGQPQGIWRTNLLEERQEQLTLAKGGRLVLPVGPCSVETLELQLATGNPAEDSQEMGPVAEPLQPIHARYWDHSLGAAPLGNLPVGITLRGQPLIGMNTRFTLTVANNQVDTEIRGAARLTAPDGWLLIPTSVPYRLAPGEGHVYEVAVTIPEGEAAGLITAELNYEGQTYSDSMIVGDLKPLQCRLQRTAGSFEVKIANPNRCAISGQVWLIGPLETWQPDEVGGYALCPTDPLVQSFQVAGEQTATVEFRSCAGSGGLLCLEHDGNAGQEQFWAIAKVTYHGKVEYLQL